MEQDPKPSNVIPGPWLAKNRPIQNMEENLRHVAMAKTTRIEQVTEELVVELFEGLYECNYDFTERDDTNKDMAFLIEALKSMMRRHDGLDHPFHALAESYFVAEENGDLVFIMGDEEEITLTEVDITDITVEE